MFQTSDHSHLEIGIIIFDTVLVFIIIAIVTDMRKAQTKISAQKNSLKMAHFAHSSIHAKTA